MSAQIRHVGKLSLESTAFLLCDIQEKFRSSIQYFSEICVVAQRLVTAANLLDIPVVGTEQYPKGLGHIVEEIDTSKMKVFEKTKFSMSLPEVHSYLEEVRPNLKSVVLFGIEAHICVMQTALDLLEKNYEVHIVVDCSSSRTMTDRLFGFERIRQSGGFITTSEAVLFMLLQDAKHPKFREVQKLVMESAPFQALVPKV
ncbi:isochorismatase domain-containing protein 2 [Hydra vulgaris]|uniref:Isochorismatase domain-containing protein 2 n=1 Tax=Hydra vulgaris TaxID=6087 RepID=A0ABM4DJH8_HYDVU